MYHLHNQFVDVFIHADDVIFLALKYCINCHDRHILQIDAQFKSGKAKCIHFSTAHKYRHENICIVNTAT